MALAVVGPVTGSAFGLAAMLGPGRASQTVLLLLVA